jgi:hypothetical protein
MRRTAKALRVFVISGLAVIGLDLMGILGVTYSRPYDNQPLSNPLILAEVRDGSLLLADGRIVKYQRESPDSSWILPDGQSFKEYFSTCRSEIEIKEYSPGQVEIRAAVPIGGYCGTPDIRLINLPLIPLRSPRYTAKLIALGDYADLIGSTGEQIGALQPATRPESQPE